MSCGRLDCWEFVELLYLECLMMIIWDPKLKQEYIKYCIFSLPCSMSCLPMYVYKYGHESNPPTPR